MGQAKKRGSFEDRLKQSQEEIKKQLKEEVKKLMQQHYEHVPNQFSSSPDYLNGCVIVMDSKDAMDICLDSLIEDGYPKPDSLSEFLDVMIGNYEVDELDSIQESAAWIDEDIGMNFMFYRFKDSSKFKVLDDVLNTVSEFSFWSPIYIMLNGHWYNTFNVGAVDSNGNTMGIRF